MLTPHESGLCSSPGSSLRRVRGEGCLAIVSVGHAEACHMVYLSTEKNGKTIPDSLKKYETVHYIR
jgi:hypothetical protein